MCRLEDPHAEKLSDRDSGTAFLRFALLGSSFLGEKPWITARLGHGAILFDAWGAAAGCKSHQG